MFQRVCSASDLGAEVIEMPAPDFLTIEEAGRILRIGRTSAYLAAKRYRDTNGEEGIPCVAIRGSLRVPRRALEAMAGGPLGDTDATSDDPPEPIDLTDRRTGPRRTRAPRRTATAEQRPLPFTS